MGMDPSSLLANNAAAGYPMGQMPMGMMNYRPGMREFRLHPVGDEGSQLPAQLMEGQRTLCWSIPPL